MDDDFKTRIALLEQDHDRSIEFLSRLDDSIEKLTDVAFSVKEILSVHEHQLKRQEDINVEIYTIIRELKAENARDHASTKNLIEQISRRLYRIERWRYAVVSGATIFGFAISSLIRIFGAL